MPSRAREPWSPQNPELTEAEIRSAHFWMVLAAILPPTDALKIGEIQHQMRLAWGFRPLAVDFAFNHPRGFSIQLEKSGDQWS